MGFALKFFGSNVEQLLLRFPSFELILEHTSSMAKRKSNILRAPLAIFVEEQMPTGNHWLLKATGKANFTKLTLSLAKKNAFLKVS